MFSDSYKPLTPRLEGQHLSYAKGWDSPWALQKLPEPILMQGFQFRSYMLVGVHNFCI